MSEWFKEHDWKSCDWENWSGGSNPLLCAIKTHAKGAYKTLLRVSFSMQNYYFRGSFLLFILFVVYAKRSIGICFSLVSHFCQVL